MIRLIIIFSTRVKRFSHCFLRIVRVYPIDTTNSPLHERETAYTQGRAAVPPWAQLSPLRVCSHAAGYSPWDAQPYYLAAMSAQPYSRVFTWDAQPYHLGAAITATSVQPCSRVFTRNTPPHRLGAVYPPQAQRKNKSGAPAAFRIPCNEMKNSPNGVKNKQRTKAVNAFLFIMQNRVKSK